MDLADVLSTTILRETARVRRCGRARREPLSPSTSLASTPLDGFCPTERPSLVVLIGRGSRGLPWLGQNLTHSSVGVVFVQETCTPQFPCLPDDQPFRYDGPENSHGREAGFLFHQDVPATRVPGLVDSFRIVCSYYAPHAGSDDSSRIQVASVRLVARVFPVYPFLLSGDANVWWPDFCLGRTRSCDRVIFPFISELIDGCGLALVNPVDRATNIAGAALDLVFVSRDVAHANLIVHQGDSCCALSPSCCPALGSDHYLCVLSVPSLLSHEPLAQTRTQRCFPIVEDWCPVLVSAQESLVRWARVVQQCLQSEPGGAARHSLQMNNLFSQLCNILWSHTRPPDRDTTLLVTHTTTAPLDANPDGGPTSAFVLWWRVIQLGAPIAALGLSQITLASLTDVSSFIALCAPHVVHSGDHGSTTSSRSTTGTPELVRVRSDVVSGFHHGLRLPLWLGRQAWTIPPNCLPASATEGGRISRLFPGHPLLPGLLQPDLISLRRSDICLQLWPL